MLRRTAKIGAVFMVTLVIGEMVQTRSVASPFLIFAADGLIPGTKLQIPAELMLIATAFLFMLVVAFLFRLRATSKRAVQAAMPKQQNKRPDPPYTTLVPGLGGAITLARAAQFYMHETVRDVTFIMRALSRPTIAQAVTLHKELGTDLVRIDRWATFRLQQRDWLQACARWLREQTDRLQAYITRLTLL